MLTKVVCIYRAFRELQLDELGKKLLGYLQFGTFAEKFLLGIYKSSEYKIAEYFERMLTSLYI